MTAPRVAPDHRSGSDRKSMWLRGASYAAVALGIFGYLLGIVVVLDDGAFAAGFLDHLAVRGIFAAVAGLLILIGVVINKPRHRLPWLLLLALVFSYTLRPLFMHTGHIMAWDGWLIFAIILFQRGADAGAIIAVVWLRKTHKITETSIELAIVMLSYAIIALHFVAIPGWVSFELLPLSLSFGVVVPIAYMIVIALTARLLFVDILRGRAFQFMLAAWILNILFDIVGHNVFEVSNSLLGAAVFDVLGLSACLWAAASLHPSMREVSRPTDNARSDWSAARSLSLFVAAAIPLAISQFEHEPFERVIFFAFGSIILLLLILRARLAVMSLLTSKRELVITSQTDALTSLSNRRHHQEIMQREVEEHREFVVLLVDIDGFKQVNDAHGHRVGDEVLREFARRISNTCPSPISLARVGGDEFAILVRIAERSAVIDLGNRIVEACGQPFGVGNLVINVGASVGINIVRASDLGYPSSTHVERADYALLHAKRLGRGRVELFTPEHEIAIKRSAVLEQTLKSADFESELTVMFQPIMNARDFSVSGFEALVRWNSPALGFVSPGEFIPLAEQSGMIHDVTRVVVQVSLRELRQWPGQIRLKINLSTNDLLSSHQMLAIVTLMQRSGVDGRRLTFEITETAFADNIEAIQESITLLRSTGASIAIDDFGTGYSSLSAVHLMHPNLIKIDKSFIDRIDDGANGAAMIKTIIEMCRNIGTRSLAEGVELESQATKLKEFGCDELQGYLFSRPVSAKDALRIAQAGTVAAAQR